MTSALIASRAAHSAYGTVKPRPTTAGNCPVVLVPRWMPDSVFAMPALGATCIAGRLLAAGVELWVLQRHVRGLLLEDVVS